MLSASTPPVLNCTYLMYSALRGLMPPHAAILALQVHNRYASSVTYVQKLWVFCMGANM